MAKKKRKGPCEKLLSRCMKRPASNKTQAAANRRRCFRRYNRCRVNRRINR